MAQRYSWCVDDGCDDILLIGGRANAFIVYVWLSIGDGGSNARGTVHYNLHRGANGPPTLVGGLVDKTDDWIDDDRRPRKYGRQEVQEMKCLAGSK